MPWQQNLPFLLRKPVGVSLADGTGVSGILCDVQGGEVYLLEYLYRNQFATRHYSFGQIQDINPYPACGPSPAPQPYPPILY